MRAGALTASVGKFSGGKGVSVGVTEGVDVGSGVNVCVGSSVGVFSTIRDCVASSCTGVA